MHLAIDADSIIYGASLCSKEEDEEGFVRDLDEAAYRFDEKFMKVINELEETYQIEIPHIGEEGGPIFFIKGKGNFRMFLYEKYKAKRKKRKIPPTLYPLTKYVRSNYQTFTADNVEVDDVIASYWHKYQELNGKDSIIIVGNDKDYFQLPALIFDTYYKRMELNDVSQEEAEYNYAVQLVTGDTVDEYNFLKGYGPKTFHKYYLNKKEDNYTPYQAAEALFKEKAGADWKYYFKMANLMVKLRTDLITIPSIF